MHDEAKRNLEFIGGERDRHLQQLWEETKIGDILPWEEVEREAERLLESTRENERNSENSHASLEQDDDRTVDQDETDPYNEVIFWHSRPDSVTIEWTIKIRSRVQSHIRSKTRLPRTGRVSDAGSA